MRQPKLSALGGRKHDVDGGHDWHHGYWHGNASGWWNHMWSDHTALMAFGTTMWGLNRLAYGFGYWGYDLKNFVEPKLSRRALNDLELPDCHVGFYDSLVVFDHHLDKTWVVSTGLAADGSRRLREGKDVRICSRDNVDILRRLLTPQDDKL